MKARGAAKATSAVLLALATIAGPTQAADTLYTNARVWTVNPDREWAEAFAVEDGRFIAVGSAEEVAGLARDGTETIDLDGAMVLPGFQDLHVHADIMYRMAALEGETRDGTKRSSTSAHRTFPRPQDET